MKKISRQRQWQLKKKAQGLCEICGKERVNASYCETHRIKMNKINLRSQNKMFKNETPEKREKRLEYSRKYYRDHKRKS